MFRKSVFVAAVVIFLTHICKAAIDGSQSNIVNANEETKNETKPNRTGKAMHANCNGSFTTKCLKIHVLSFLEDLNSREELPLLFPGLSIVKENKTDTLSAEELAAEIGRKFPGKTEEKLNRFIIYRLQDYLDGHSLRYKLLDPQTTKRALDMVDASVGRRRGGGGGGGLGGGKGGGGGLIAAAMMMKGALGAAALAAIALLAGKALMAALVALLLSALVGMKGHGGHKSTTYEIITKPEVSHHHSHSHEEQHEHDHGHHGGYRRAYDMAYNSYIPYDTTSPT